MTIRDKTCCFSGHRELPNSELAHISEKLYKLIESLILQGVIYFGTGGALGFDTLAALTILELRKEYAHIKLILVLPCKEQAKNWKLSDIVVYEQIKTASDKITYTSENYYRGCMQKRNRHLVDNSAYCICYLTQEKGGTRYTVDYALQNNLAIYNLTDK